MILPGFLYISGYGFNMGISGCDINPCIYLAILVCRQLVLPLTFN